MYLANVKFACVFSSIGIYELYMYALQRHEVDALVCLNTFKKSYVLVRNDLRLVNMNTNLTRRKGHTV